MRNIRYMSLPIAVILASCTSTIFRSAGINVTKADTKDTFTGTDGSRENDIPPETDAPQPTPTPTQQPGDLPTPTPTPNATAFPTSVPSSVKTCSKRVSGAISANDGMYNRNPACGPVGSIDMVTSSALMFLVPPGTKNLKIASSNISFGRGSCAAVVLTYTTHPQGPYHYEGNCQRIAPEFETMVGGGVIPVKDLTPTTHPTYLIMYCKAPRLQSLGMGQNASGYDIAAMDATASFDYSFETHGDCAP